MSENTTESESVEAEELTADVEVILDRGDSFHLDELREKFGAELIDGDLEEVVKQRVRSLHDNQEMIAQQLQQAQQAQQGGGGPLGGM